MTAGAGACGGRPNGWRVTRRGLGPPPSVLLSGGKVCAVVAVQGVQFWMHAVLVSSVGSVVFACVDFGCVQGPACAGKHQAAVRVCTITIIICCLQVSTQSCCCHHLWPIFLHPAAAEGSGSWSLAAVVWQPVYAVHVTNRTVRDLWWFAVQAEVYISADASASQKPACQKKQNPSQGETSITQ